MKIPSPEEIERKIRTALHQAGFEAYATLTPRFAPQIERVIEELVALQVKQWDDISTENWVGMRPK